MDSFYKTLSDYKGDHKKEDETSKKPDIQICLPLFVLSLLSSSLLPDSVINNLIFWIAPKSLVTFIVVFSF